MMIVIDERGIDGGRWFRTYGGGIWIVGVREAPERDQVIMVHYSTYMLNAVSSAVETAPAEKGESSGGHSHTAADSTCHASGSGTFLAVPVALGDG